MAEDTTEKPVADKPEDKGAKAAPKAVADKPEDKGAKAAPKAVADKPLDKAPAPEAAPARVRVKNNHHQRLSYTWREGPQNPGPRVAFNDLRGHEQLVTEEQAQALCALRYTVRRDNGRTEDRQRFVRV